MAEELDLPAPERFTIGTEGPVGQRLFLLQCRQGTQLLTVKIEKQQVAVLASYLARIVRELGSPETLADDLDLEEVADFDWICGTIGVSYDEDLNRVMVVLEELVEEGEDPTVARVAVTPEQAGRFAVRATSLIEAGRPACPLCGLPLDPSGHICPRTNGHRPPVT